MELLLSVVFTRLACYDRKSEADVMAVTLICVLWKEQVLVTIRKQMIRKACLLSTVTQQ
jgi:hypothetical protein